MTDPYVKHWNELVESDLFEWADDDEDENKAKAFCPKCGLLKLAHKGDRCPTRAGADAFVLGGVMSEEDR